MHEIMQIENTGNVKRHRQEQAKMFRLIKFLFYLAVIGGIAVVGYALFFELPAPQNEVTVQIQPDLD